MGNKADNYSDTFTVVYLAARSVDDALAESVTGEIFLFLTTCASQGSSDFDLVLRARDVVSWLCVPMVAAITVDELSSSTAIAVARYSARHVTTITRSFESVANICRFTRLGCVPASLHTVLPRLHHGHFCGRHPWSLLHGLRSPSPWLARYRRCHACCGRGTRRVRHQQCIQ